MYILKFQTLIENVNMKENTGKKSCIEIFKLEFLTIFFSLIHNENSICQLVGYSFTLHPLWYDGAI